MRRSEDDERTRFPSVIVRSLRRESSPLMLVSAMAGFLVTRLLY